MIQPSVAVIGALTHMGQSVLTALAERGFAAQSVYALDAHQNADTLIPYQEGLMTVSPLDSFDFTRAAVVFLCADTILAEYKEQAIRSGCYVIDCVHLFDNVPVIIPDLNMKDAVRAPNRQIANPTGPTVTLAQVLHPIHKAFHIRHVSVTALLSASEFGLASAQALIDQTRCLYTRLEPPKGPFNKVQAFNLLPEPDPCLTRRTMAQLRELVGIPVFVGSCLVPILLGECYAVSLATQKKCTGRQLCRLFQKNPCCQVLQKELDYITVTTQDVETEDKIYIEHVRDDVPPPHTLHFWVVSDSVRTGAAINAVRIAEHLLS